MVQSDRRTVLKHTGASLATLATPSLAQAKATGANEKIVMGAIVCGGQGTGLLTSFAGMQGVELAYVRDPDTAHANIASRLDRSLRFDPATETTRPIMRSCTRVFG